MFWVVLLWPYALAVALLWVLWFAARYIMISWFAGDRLVRRTKDYRPRHSSSETVDSTTE